MKIEIVKKTSWRGTFYHVRVDGMTENLFEKLEDAENLYNEIIGIIQEGEAEKVIKSIEI
jgi:hypothetical protein